MVFYADCVQVNGKEAEIIKYGMDNDTHLALKVKNAKTLMDEQMGIVEYYC